MTPSKEHWQVNTERIARLILDAAAKSHSEEDVKMAVEPILRSAMKQMGIDVSMVRYEKTTTVFGGRRDSVYGYLTIEYKRPGRLASRTDAAAAAQQLEGYLAADAAKSGGDHEDYLEKAVGIAIDGEQVMFVLFSKSGTQLQLPVPQVGADQLLFPDADIRRGFQVLGPYPVSTASIASLLIYLRAAERQPLTAQALAAVFAPPQDIACQAVSQLYAAVMRAQRQQSLSRVRTFFDEWERIFGIVYGEEIGKAEEAAARTAQLYKLPGGVRLPQLLFAIHTYYALLMKLVALELVALQRDANIESFVAGLDALPDSTLRDRLSEMESGAEFLERGITNFLEADFFSWYIDAWDNDLGKAIRGVIRGLAQFEPATPILEPDWTRDLLQNLYEDIVPRELRHTLGEYYTPNWLAGYLIDRTGYKGKKDTRFLDPASGSGTVLVQAIHRAIHTNRARTPAAMKELGEHILANIVGFDLNPLAVLASRTNYLIAFARFIPYVRPIALPVYLCDSVRAPSRYVEEGKLDLDDRLVFTTSKGDYEFPLVMQNREMIDKFTGMVDVAIRGIGKERRRMPVPEFRAWLERDFKLREPDAEMLLKVYEKIRKLDEAGENGIWARYIKNAFAPVFLEKFDFVVGNPPWIRWGYLSAEYRKATLRMWQNYGLFSLKGHETRLGAGEKDFSMLFVYACADNYLKPGGKLGFVITMEVFKSKGAGEGFRGFELKDKRVPLKMLWMEDMVNLLPFRAANKTAIFALQKGKRTRYPVPVKVWERKQGVGPIPPQWELEKVKSSTTRQSMDAVPVDPDRPSSSWQTASCDELAVLAHLKGASPYKAYRGASTEPYGVFWLRVKEVRPDGLLVIENMHDRGKREIKSVSVSIEPTLVHPAVSGGDITRWGIKSNCYVVMSQDPKTREPYPHDWMMSEVPLTYAYLNQFKNVLLSRGSRIVREFAEKTEFYAMYGIGEYSVAKYRVTWKRMASRIEAVVLSTLKTPFSTKTLISTDTTAFFALDDRQEAHYLCAVLDSHVVDDYIRSFSSAGRGFGAPSVMENVAFPKFDAKNKLHARLAELSEEAHALVKADKATDEIERQVDEAVRKLWNIKS